ncbi:hypothetical protein Ahy_B01g054283 [Arachis hypogaea]|uniref:BED-type domain-containing protein n=1 Tax=Arachis hypogaea TaxID=3818 RepID=A0A445ATM1_ARAHY|nr:hypothetical protein Ahy_B01g054283 [Arachis hypogaea]
MTAGMSASTQPSFLPSENAIEKKAKCKYCGCLIQYGSGTSSMGGHLRRCKQNPNNDSNKRIKTTTTPTIDKRDWEYADSIVPFLQVFSDATIRISGTLYVTSDIYMKEVFVIGRFIRHSCDSVDFSTMSMVARMRVKYEKY